MDYFPYILSWISFELYHVDLIQSLCQHWKERLTDVPFYFRVRVEVEVKDANERIFLWGQMQTGDFSFGVRIGIEDAKSLDLLHDLSLSMQTCLRFSCFQADAFCTWRKCSGKSWQREKKSRNSQTHHSEYSFLQRKNK